MKIPIQNIYYLLCYAWNKLSEGNKVNVSNSEYSDLLNLLARVLVNGCNILFKRGLDRNYIETTTEYVGIKGKIDFRQSLSKNLFRQGKSICTFDEFTENILPNQLIKATLSRLLKYKYIDIELKTELQACYTKLFQVDVIQVRPILFSQVSIHRNNSFYDFLVKICRLIFENTSLEQDSGTYTFKEFFGSDKEMANLFESFIRNFYIKKLHQNKVYRENIDWKAKPLGMSTNVYLPKMQTDVSIELEHRKIIIETKYYGEALTARFDSSKFNSSNLYQIYAYLKNIENKSDTHLNVNCEGILIYPTVDYTLDESFQVEGHILRVKTINLNQDWRDIEADLLDIVSPF